MNLKDLENPILFTLPYAISAEDQQAIIDYAYTHANSWSGQVQVWDDDRDQYDQTDYFGRVQITRLTQDSIDRIAHDGNLNSNWINWAARLDPTLDWEWIDTPITPVLKKYVDQIRHLYVRFNRVLILVQKPGSAIPMHTDKVVKNRYVDEKFAPGPAEDLFLKENNLHWESNRYLTLKWPLTEIPGDNGAPKININGHEYRYDVGNELFAINEVDITHGADAVAHRRGVIFLDGLLDYEALKKETWKSVKLIEKIFDNHK
jgi:hypothetical protein